VIFTKNAGPVRKSIRTLRIGRYTGPTGAGLQNQKIVPIDIAIAIKLSVLAVGVVLRHVCATQTNLEMGKIIQVNVAIAMKATSSATPPYLRE